MIIVFSTPASVLALNESSVTEVKSSALSDALDYDWKVSTSGSKLTLEVRDARAGTTGDSWYASAYYTQSGTVVTLDEAAFSGTTCTATYDFSAVPDGIKNLVIDVYVKSSCKDNAEITSGSENTYNMTKAKERVQFNMFCTLSFIFGLLYIHFAILTFFPEKAIPSLMIVWTPSSFISI